MIRLAQAVRDAWHTLMDRQSRSYAVDTPVVKWLKEQQQESEQNAAQSDERLQRVNMMEQAFMSDPSRKRGTQ